MRGGGDTDTLWVRSLRGWLGFESSCWLINDGRGHGKMVLARLWAGVVMGCAFALVPAPQVKSGLASPPKLLEVYISTR